MNRHSVNRHSVLAIDDSPEIHDLLAVRLRSEGIALQHAFGGGQGLADAARLRPDLILLDLDMPHMTGFEVCRRLKEEPATRDIPVIFLSSAEQVQSKVQGFDLGAIDYITKPFETAELRARVRAALRTKDYLDQLAARAQVDGLTTLWNRAHFDRRLAEEVAAARRYARTVSLVLLDLDHFKQLNDGFGHPVGDRVLRAVGETLWRVLRSVDTPCRYGGEEIACILTETGFEGAVVAAQRMREAIAGLALVHDARTIPVTASLGVASTELFVELDLMTADGLVELADQALYSAKRAGRNRVCRAPTQRLLVTGDPE